MRPMRIVKSVNNHSLEPGLVFFDIETTGLSAQSAMAALTMLQLKGYVREEAGRYRLLVSYDQ